MPTETLTSSAPDLDTLIQETEQEAIDQVAEREGRLTDIRQTHKEAIRERLLSQIKGTDGASAQGELTLPSVEEAEAKVDEQAAEREERFEPDMHVAHFEGNQVGEQRDGDRKILVGASIASVQTEEAQAKEVNDHENRHKNQKGADGGAVAETGNKEIDDMLKLDHLAYREEDAMFIAGDEFTSHQYTVDYKEPVIVWGTI